MTSLHPTMLLPGTDLAVSPLAIGTMYWGTDTTVTQSLALLDAVV